MSSFLATLIFGVVGPLSHWETPDFEPRLFATASRDSGTAGSNRKFSPARDGEALKHFLMSKGEKGRLSQTQENLPYRTLFSKVEEVETLQTDQLFFGYVRHTNGSLSLFSWRHDEAYQNPIDFEKAIRIYLDEKMAKAESSEQLTKWKQERALLISALHRSKKDQLEVDVFRSVRPIGHDFSRLELMTEPVLVLIPARGSSENRVSFTEDVGRN